MDDALVPVSDRRAAASSHTYWFSAKVQVIAGLDTRLAAAARPVPGTTAEAKA